MSFIYHFYSDCLTLTLAFATMLIVSVKEIFYENRKYEERYLFGPV
jgi:hypothetical protein